MTPTPLLDRARARELLGGCPACLLRRGGLLGGLPLTLAWAPVSLGVQTHRPQPVAPAPGTLDRAGAAAEVRYDTSGAAAGHTLPRLMSALAEILAVVVLACHEPIRLAFPA
jgi:hypothetical protein